MSSPFDPIPEPSTGCSRGCLRWGCGTFVVLFMLMDLAMGSPVLQWIYIVVRWFGFGCIDYAAQNVREVPRDWWMAGVAAFVVVVGIAVLTIRAGDSALFSSRPLSPKGVSLLAVVVFAWLGIAAFTSAADSLRWWFSSRPRVLTVENSFDRFDSQHQLTRMSHAVDTFVKRNQALPVLGEPDPQGEWTESWARKIAPFLDEDHGPTRWWRNPRIKHRDVAELDDCHYAGNIRVLGRSVPADLAQIPDGSTQTLLIGEVESGFRHWRDPRNLRDPALGIRRGTETFCGSSVLRPGANFLFADGRVKFLDSRIDPKVLKQLATPDDGD